jgi:hypothetical protein
MPGSSATVWSIAAPADVSTMRLRMTARAAPASASVNVGVGVGGAAVEAAHPECRSRC